MGREVGLSIQTRKSQPPSPRVTYPFPISPTPNPTTKHLAPPLKNFLSDLERAGGGSLSRGLAGGMWIFKWKKGGWGKGSEKGVLGMNSMLRREKDRESQHKASTPSRNSPRRPFPQFLQTNLNSNTYSRNLFFLVGSRVLNSLRLGMEGEHWSYLSFCTGKKKRGERTFLHGHETPPFFPFLSPPPFPILPSLPSNPSTKQVQPRIFSTSRSPWLNVSFHIERAWVFDRVYCVGLFGWDGGGMKRAEGR